MRLLTSAQVAARLETLLARRDSLVRQAFAEGHSSREVGAAARMSHVGVLKIARR
jgi:hypothetical protein